VNNFLFEFGSANLSELTGSSCPYILQNIPDGTKVVKFVSENNYCATVDVEKLDCDYFNFQLITNKAVSRIITGNVSLKASNTNLSDYSIAWYGPDNKNNLVFTSGKGSFSYDFTDPINQPVEGGTYYPVVQNVKFNGKTFSNTGGTDQIYVDLEDCLEPQVIQPCNCGNRTASINDIYSHSYSYVAESQTNPVTVTLSLVLSAGTKYVGWSFTAYKFIDRLTIYFKGSAYPVQIGLDDWAIGGDITSNSFVTNIFPKSASTPSDQALKKVITLEKFTVNDNDKIIFQITPSNNKTDWDFKYGCFGELQCPTCIFDQGNNYRIPKSSITVNYDTGKCETEVFYKVSNNCTVDNDFFLLNNFEFFNFKPYRYPAPNSSIQFLYSFYLNKLVCANLGYGNQDDKSRTCGNPFTFTRSNNGSVNVLTFSGNPIDIDFYYNQLITNIQTYSGTTTTDNTKPDYYNFIFLNIPTQDSISCEKTRIDRVIVPVSSSIVKSPDNKTLTITPNVLTYNPAVLNNLMPGLCTNCLTFFTENINLINGWTTGFTTLYSINIPDGRPKDFVYLFNKVDISIRTFSAFTEGGYVWYTPAITNTLPFSGSNVYIPSLSASTCPQITCGGLDNTTQIGVNYLYEYRIELIDQTDKTAFKIMVNPIQNCVRTNNYQNIYIFSGDVVQYFDPNYII